VTPHSLRRTYASCARRQVLSGAYLAAFIRALHWAEIGRIGAEAVAGLDPEAMGEGTESPLLEP
jgi:hypothetical protein